jgi:trk system potassium uptake protein TrkA
MKILVIGGGEVGFHLAGELVRENHDVTVVESDPERLQHITKTLDVMVVEGDGTGRRVLESAGISSADMLIAVTNSDEGNILACMIAREFGVTTKIARVRDHELSYKDSVLAPERIGIDLMIHPELETAIETIRLIRHPAATDVMEFFDSRVVLLGLRVIPESPVVGKTLIDLGRQFVDLPYRVVAISRGSSTLIPKGSHRIEEDDLIYAITQQEAATDVVKLVKTELQTTHDLMILGASRVGQLLAESLQNDHDINVKLVDLDPDKAQRVAGRLKDTLVVEADGRNIDVIAAEGLIDMDAFVACTDDDETNIVTSLVARHLGVRSVITLVEKKFYLPIIKAIGLEVGVNKHILTSNAILKYIRHGKVITFSQVRGINAETIVFSVDERAKITKKPLEKLNFPDGSMIGAVRRGDDVFIPTGKTQITGGDEALVFYLPDARDKVDSWFK